MKPLYTPTMVRIDTLLFGNLKCDVYKWIAPDGTEIAVHMILPCPNCSYPISLAVSEFSFSTHSLAHKIICPGRWKDTYKQVLGDKTLTFAQIDNKGKALIKRCGFQGILHEGLLRDVRP